MNKYIIYCTEEQIKKAIELGAPILTKTFISSFGKIETNLTTAEQMLGWLEDCYDEVDITIKKYSNGHWTYLTEWKSNGYYDSRRDATLAAIDATLDYLIKIKEEKI